MRSLLSGIVERFRSAPRVVARYDAAVGGSTQRAEPPPAMHVCREIRPQDRLRLIAKARDLYDNSPMMHGIIERFVTYVVGSGIHPFSRSESSRFRKWADAQWAEYAKSPDVTDSTDIVGHQSQMYRAECNDGDGGKIYLMPNGLPKVWSVEGYEIGGRGWLYTPEEFDGVRRDAYGKPVAYLIRKEEVPTSKDFIRVDAPNFNHHFHQMRARQVRGVPMLASALDWGLDVKEILQLEKIAQKEFASHTDIITTETGHIAPDRARQISMGIVAATDGGPDSQAYYRQVFGPSAKVIKRGDSWTAFKSDRPGQAWQGFIDFLANSIVLGARGMPPSVILGQKVGGADSRREISAAKRVIEAEQHRLACQYQRDWEFVIRSQRHLYSGELPADWNLLEWQFPQSITVDYGREAAQDRADVASALMTRREFWARYGLNPRAQDLRVIEEARERKKDIEDSGMTVPEFVALVSLDPKLFTPKPEQPDEKPANPDEKPA